ncbi:hypothetical protein [Streptomyces sp. CB02400]|uniref:hypothetical protein n=1 Tax=Streptomyces sp. CB02400 TaxID=1703944 RepID=UPI00093D9D98|nr:hypothetical protein [Streptomyces sp. CB02400]
MTVTDLDRAPATMAPGTDAPLRARPGLHYAPVPGGVYFSGTRGQFVLSGSDLMYAVADGCVPLLETGTTEDALVAEFGTERARPAVRHLVARLRENGLLLDPAAFTEPEPPAEVRARYADTLARLTARLDDPYAAFARLRRARVELRGPATATAPARRGLHRAGVTTTPPTAGTATPLVPVCDPAMYADPALLTPAGDPAVHEPTTPAGDPAARKPGPLTPTGDPAADKTRTTTPAAAPAARTPRVPIPAGDPAVREPTTPAGDPAVRTSRTLTPTGDPAADKTRTTTPVSDPAVRGDQAVIPVGGPAVDFPGAGGSPRAVIEFLTGDGTWTERHGTLHVPVLLGPGPVLVGPVGVSPAVWAAFRDRAGVWAGAEGVEPAAGPVAHSLAGALAAQLLADTLTGVAEPGEAHVVHGPDLTADRVTVTGGPVDEAVVVRLDDAPAEPLPEPAAALEEAAALTARWTGLFASAQGEHLPQMPLALRAAEHRTDRTDTVTAWAAHQETATVAAALAALRDRDGGAAGLTREHWLLDGALRWLAERRDRFEHLTDTAPPLHAEGERILAALRARLGPAVPVLALARTAGVDWPLAEVTAGGRPLGAGWGPTAADATYAALCTALAAAQADGTVDTLSTDALLTADDTARTALRRQLTALATIRGQARRTDPVLGELPFWHGPVTARTAQEPTDADH